jgi:hypothetical protein
MLVILTLSIQIYVFFSDFFLLEQKWPIAWLKAIKRTLFIFVRNFHATATIIFHHQIFGINENAFNH